MKTLRGIALIARGRRAGVTCFGDTERDFLNSLAPLIAFPLLVGVVTILSTGDVSALTELLGIVCSLLAPPVLSHAIAAAWRREELWLRYATAFNWSQWAVPMAAAALIFVLEGAIRVGMPVRGALGVGLLALLIYAVWLHWFVAREALRLTGLRAILLVIAVGMGTGVLVLGPRVIANAMAPAPVVSPA